MEKRKWVRWRACIIAAVLLLWAAPQAQAAERSNETESQSDGRAEETPQSQEAPSEDMDVLTEQLLRQFEFTELEKLLGQMLPEQKITFRGLLGNLLEGDLKQTGEMIGRWIRDRMFYELRTGRNTLKQLLLLAVLAAALTNFSGLVRNRHISDIGFYLLYLMIVTLGISSFAVVLQAAQENLQLLTEFMKVLAPVYFLAVGLTCGLTSSAMFYHMILVLIYLTELVAIRLLLPLIHVQVLVRVLNDLSEEDYLSKFGELLELGAGWILKLLFSGVVGLNLVQGLLGPALDAVGRKTIFRGLEMLPGVGDIAGGISQIAAGAAMLIKNGIGVGAAVICVLVCIAPVIQTAVLVFLYKAAAAVIQPVSDRRITDCLSGIGDGCRMVLRVILTSGILFLITIAIVASTTGQGGV